MAHNSEIEKLERRWADNPLGLTFAPLAEAYRRAGDHPRALEVLEVGLAHHPAYVPAQIVRARCHLDAGLDGAAESSFRSVLLTDAHNLIALKGLADICERTGRHDETRLHLERLLEADPTHEEASAQLARAIEHSGSAPVTEAGPASDPVLEAPPPAVSTMATIEANETGPEPIETAADWTTAPAFVDASSELLVLESTEVDLPDSVAASQVEGAPLDELGTEVAADEATSATPAPPALELERDDNPFEGFDPAGWDLPFTDAEVPAIQFEETASLVDVSMEQVYESLPTASDAPAVEGLIHSAMTTEDADTAAALTIEGPSSGLGDGAGAPVSDEDSLPRDPLDIPEFAVWDSAMEPAPTEGDTPTVEFVAEAEPAAEGALATWDPPPPAAEVPDPADGPWGVPVAGGEVEEAPTGNVGQGADDPVVDEPAYVSEVEPWDAAPLGSDDTLGAMDEAPLADASTEPPGPAPWDDGDDVVMVVEGAAEETPLDQAEPESAPEEPDLVVTETMARVFLRQGHKPLALAVYAQLLERDPANPELASAVARLRGELLPSEGQQASATSAAEEPVGAFLARVLGPDMVPPAPAAPPPPEAPAGGHPTQPALDPSLSLTSIFGEDSNRARPGAQPMAAPSDADPSFDEFFGARGGAAGVPAGAGGQDEEDLEQFNAWLRGLQR